MTCDNARLIKSDNVRQIGQSAAPQRVDRTIPNEAGVVACLLQIA
jgi:hypothetical protein